MRSHPSSTGVSPLRRRGGEDIPGGVVAPPLPTTPPTTSRAPLTARLAKLVTSPLASLLPATLLALLALLAVSWPPAHSGAEPPVSERWRSWPVSRVFPATINGVSPSGAGVRYLLNGDPGETACETALHPAAARRLTMLGCVTVLRATYTDSTHTFVITAGIAVLAGGMPAASAVLPDGLSADSITPPHPGNPSHRGGPAHPAEPADPDDPAHPDGSARPGAPVIEDRGGRDRPPTVRPMAVRGSPADGFGERQYIAGALVAGHDRYVALTAAGYTDARPYTPGEPAEPRLLRAARDIAGALHEGLTR